MDGITTFYQREKIMSTTDDQIEKMRRCIDSHVKKIQDARENILAAQEVVRLEEGYLVKDRSALSRLLDLRAYDFLHGGKRIYKVIFYVACFVVGLFLTFVV